MDTTKEHTKPLIVLVPRRDETRDGFVVSVFIIGFIVAFIALHKMFPADVMESLDRSLDSGVGSIVAPFVLAVPLMTSQRFRSFSAVRCEFYRDYLRYRFCPNDSPDTESIVIPYFEIRGLKMRQGPRQAKRGVADICFGIASRKLQREACCWLGRDFYLFDVPVADHQFDKIHSIIGQYFRQNRDALETRQHLEEHRSA